jgi:hypothetical protein
MTASRVSVVGKFVTVLTLVGAALIAFGCGSAAEDEGEGFAGADVGTTAEALVRAGSNAQFVSTTIPATMYPGERRLVSVTMKNTGTASPFNDWTAQNPQYTLASLNNNVDWHYAYVGITVPAGATTTFSFVITAPPVSAPFTARMMDVTGGVFGDVVNVPITVSASVTPQWGCTLVSSTLPAQLAPDENRTVTVTVRNTGTAAWPSTNLKLASRDVPANLWGTTNADLTASVAPGGAASFAFNLKAPAAPGSYLIQRDMKDYAGIGDFRKSGLCVTQTIAVGGTPPLSAAVVSQDFPAEILPGESKTVTVVMKNTGSQTWAADGSYMLYSLNTPVNVWGRTQALVGATTVSGASAAFAIPLSVLLAPGDYHHRWQMRKIGGTDAGFFGEIIDAPVNIPSVHFPDYNSKLVSIDVPTTMIADQAYDATITLQNTGFTPWPAGTELFRSSVPGWFGGVSASVPSGPGIPRGQTYAFHFTLTAPSAPGAYEPPWDLFVPGAGQFGNDLAIAARMRTTVTVTGQVTAPAFCPVHDPFPHGFYNLDAVSARETNDGTTRTCEPSVTSTYLLIVSTYPSSNLILIDGGLFGSGSSVRGVLTELGGGRFHGSGDGPVSYTDPGYGTIHAEFDIDQSTGFVTNFVSTTTYPASSENMSTTTVEHVTAVGWTNCDADPTALPPPALPPVASPGDATACKMPGKVAPYGCSYVDKTVAAGATCANTSLCDSLSSPVSCTAVGGELVALCCE